MPMYDTTAGISGARSTAQEIAGKSCIGHEIWAAGLNLLQSSRGHE